MQKRETVANFKEVAAIAAFIDFLDKLECVHPKQSSHNLWQQLERFLAARKVFYDYNLKNDVIRN